MYNENLNSCLVSSKMYTHCASKEVDNLSQRLFLFEGITEHMEEV